MLYMKYYITNDLQYNLASKTGRLLRQCQREIVIQIFSYICPKSNPSKFKNTKINFIYKHTNNHYYFFH